MTERICLILSAAAGVAWLTYAVSGWLLGTLGAVPVLCGLLVLTSVWALAATVRCVMLSAELREQEAAWVRRYQSLQEEVAILEKDGDAWRS